MNFMMLYVAVYSLCYSRTSAPEEGRIRRSWAKSSYSHSLRMSVSAYNSGDEKAFSVSYTDDNVYTDSSSTLNRK